MSFRAFGLFVQIQLRSRGNQKTSGRSKFAKMASETHSASPRTRDSPGMTKAELQNAAKIAASEAKMLEEVRRMLTTLHRRYTNRSPIT